jgi:hypothetical protein
MAEQTQNFSRQYRQFIQKEERISRMTIQPNDVYRISTYKYSDGKTRSLKGVDETLIFVTGVYKNVIYGLKLSDLKPQYFFEWGKKIITDKEVLNEDKKLVLLSELAPSLDISGDRIYKAHIKNSELLKKPQIPFRTYNLNGIKYVSKVYFKKEILERYYA